jgi:peptide chain release factor 2
MTSAVASPKSGAHFDARIPVAGLDAFTADLQALADLLATGGAEKSLGDELTALEQTLSDIELRALLDDPLDRADAFVSLRAAADAVDDAAWVESLLNMYTRWAERSGFSTQTLFGLVHEQAGLRAAVIRIRGTSVYGRLRGEVGVHRCIRRSPFDPAGRRRTAYAFTDVLPDLADDAVELRPEDLLLETFRHGGAASQYL